MPDVDTSQIKEWRSIFTLILFILTNIIILFPFNMPIFIPRLLSRLTLNSLAALRIISPRPNCCSCTNHDQLGTFKHAFVRLNLPMNSITAPLIADLFLLAISAIGRKEIHDGTIGTNSISPIDIIAFFITLAYIINSIDASGIIRYLASRLLQWGGRNGHRVFLYFYIFFFVTGALIGNDLVILSGTSFLANFNRVSTNIVHPRAWIHAQFAVAKISSAILVSSNPANLILASAFNIKFIHYTANIVIPIIATATALFPLLLYTVFPDEALIPLVIKMHDVSEDEVIRRLAILNTSNARGARGEEEEGNLDHNLLDARITKSFLEITNPFLDKSGAIFGVVIINATIITVLAYKTVTHSTGEYPLYWVTLPAAFIMFCGDVTSGWYRRYETRMTARQGRLDIEAQAERTTREQQEDQEQDSGTPSTPHSSVIETVNTDDLVSLSSRPSGEIEGNRPEMNKEQQEGDTEMQEMQRREQVSREMALRPGRGLTLVSLLITIYEWCQGTFPTATTVLSHLPFAFVPFAFSMFVLVQAMVTKGWVAVFAYGWDHWVSKTGAVGAVGGMGFLSVILCNFAGTDIGTTILLSRVLQDWQTIHQQNGIPIPERTFWATIYSMALGVNYGAFSVSFRASMAGLLWRDILTRNHLRLGNIEFARVNFPIIVMAMTIGCVVLVGEVYIVRGEKPYDL